PVPADRCARRAHRAGRARTGRGARPDRRLRRAAALEGRLPRMRARTLAGGLALLCALAGPARASDDAALQPEGAPAIARTPAGIEVSTDPASTAVAQAATSTPPGAGVLRSEERRE